MNKKKGFTLAELLIVVAIIAVLVGVAIPVFTSSLNKSKIASDKANCRSLYAEYQADYLGNTGTTYTSKASSATTNTGKTLVFISGENVDLSYGTAAVTFTTDKGYKVVYTCTDSGQNDTWGN